MISQKISINIRNYEFSGINYTGLSPLLIRFIHMESEGGRGKKYQEVRR